MNVSKQRVQIRRQQARVAFLFFAVLLIASAGCSRQTSSKHADTKTTTEVSSAGCLDAAKNALGVDAQVAKCGHLIGDSSLVVVAVVRLEQPGNRKQNADGGTTVSRLVILQKGGSEWRTELDASN